MSANIMLKSVPNTMTVLRLAAAPLVAALIWADDPEVGYPVALVLFILASVSDFFDGWMARRLRIVSKFGTMLDPIADKVLIGGALIALALVSELPWWVVVVILARELGITLFRLAVLRDRVIPASRGGKLKTVLQAVTLSSWLVPTWVILGEWVFILNDIMMGAVILVTVMTGLDYLWKGLRAPRATP